MTLHAPKLKYCRGCNKEFLTADETPESFVEKGEKPGDLNYHPKVDCDDVG